MVSLKEYPLTEIRSRIVSLLNKLALVLDDYDIDNALRIAIDSLDEMLYLPRSVVLDHQFLISKNGGVFIDVTSLNIDVICRVYFSGDEVFEGDMTGLGMGLLPFLTGTQGMSLFQDISGYLVLRGNLNNLNRKMNTTDDYELWPVDSDGRRLLQIRGNPALVRFDYLPHLDSQAQSLFLYPFEHNFILEYTKAYCMLQNLEIILSASPLGFGKDEAGQLNYWKEKLDSLKKSFTETRVLSWLV